MRTEILLEQGSQEWLNFRVNHRMASETPAVMGLSPYQKPSDIRRIKNGGGSGFVNSAMRQGNQQEPIARKAYEERYEMIRPAVFVDGLYGASLDGINLDLNGIWECKVPVDGFASERAKAALKGELLPYDYAQVQHQLMVTGANWCHFCVWDVEQQDFVLVHVNPDPAYWEKICLAWDDFWENLGLRTDRAWTKAVKEYRLAKAQVDVATELLDSSKARLQELLVGDCNEGEGVRVQRITVAGRTDWKKVQQDLLGGADLTSYKTADTVQVRINEIKE
jgi:putative phage-type endonuclease